MADQQNVIITEEEKAELSLWPFDRLPQAVRDWLRSETVERIIVRIYEQYGDAASDPAGVSRCLTRLVLGTMEPKEFTATLATEFTTSPEAARAMTLVVSEKILKPIEKVLQDKLGIKAEGIISEISVPTARVTELKQPLITDIRPPKPLAQPVAPPPSRQPIRPAPTTIETEKPIGLKEVPPMAPPSAQHAEITEYRDEHPVIE